MKINEEHPEYGNIVLRDAMGFEYRKVVSFDTETKETELFVEVDRRHRETGESASMCLCVWQDANNRSLIGGGVRIPVKARGYLPGVKAYNKTTGEEIK